MRVPKLSDSQIVAIVVSVIFCVCIKLLFSQPESQPVLIGPKEPTVQELSEETFITVERLKNSIWKIETWGYNPKTKAMTKKSEAKTQGEGNKNAFIYSGKQRGAGTFISSDLCEYFAERPECRARKNQRQDGKQARRPGVRGRSQASGRISEGR